jgi:hypothetical protein
MSAMRWQWRHRRTNGLGPAFFLIGGRATVHEETYFRLMDEMRLAAAE